MALYIKIHPDNPQPRLIAQTVKIINEGGVIVYPTDSSYALGCHLGDKRALDRIRSVRQLDAKHNFTLVCRDLAQVSQFTKFNNHAHRLVKSLTPGAYTFILNATREVPRRLMHPKRKSIGIRIPDNPIVRDLLEELAEPLVSTTLVMPGEEEALTDPYDIRERLENQVDIIVDSGYIPVEPTTIIDASGDIPEIVRYGKGEAPPL
ncbi:MAG: L-threonylcarbamoyladenylate synthase [Methylococcales bacterium]